MMICFLVTDLYSGWKPVEQLKTGQVGGLQILLSDYRNLDKVNDPGFIFQLEDAAHGEIYCSRTVC